MGRGPGLAHPQAADKGSLRLSLGQGLLFGTCSDPATPNAAGSCSDCDACMSSAPRRGESAGAVHCSIQ